ncbi:hypothetical protein B0H15DRAFT_800586 [Mycena belliarum]|uniref:Uncharacterized protein n=1 Tax=Mycena belliarum TaxID=1033014 RepID=A0AAD6XPB7_9AGAR|nr:hypothetical protein B0H15DRAFT_800586 [Mycena belliae]
MLPVRLIAVPTPFPNLLLVLLLVLPIRILLLHLRIRIPYPACSRPSPPPAPPPSAISTGQDSRTSACTSAPSVRPVMPTATGLHDPPRPRPQTAPVELGGGDPGLGRSWYRQAPAAQQRPIPPPSGVAHGSGATWPPQFIPIQTGPTVAQLPPVFSSLMEILRSEPRFIDATAVFTVSVGR